MVSIFTSPVNAMASISTSAPNGSLATCTQDLAGKLRTNTGIWRKKN